MVINSLICRKGQYHNSTVDKVNQISVKLCHENSFYLIENSSITQDHLYIDGLHLQESEKIILYFSNYTSNDVNSEFWNLKFLGTLDNTEKKSVIFISVVVCMIIKQWY